MTPVSISHPVTLTLSHSALGLSAEGGVDRCGELGQKYGFLLSRHYFSIYIWMSDSLRVHGLVISQLVGTAEAFL